MSSDALIWAKKMRVGDATRKAVLLILADYADEAGSCFPSQATIAVQAEVSERSVRRVLMQFEDVGFLRRERRSGGHYGRTSDRLFLDLGWPTGDVAPQSKPDAPDLQPDTGTGSKRDDEAVDDDLQPATQSTQPDCGSTQPDCGDRATGHSLADEPPRTTTDPREQSSSSLHARAADPEDDDTITAAAQLAAIRDLDRYQADRKAGKRDAEGAPLKPVVSYRKFLAGCADNWLTLYRTEAVWLLEQFPTSTAEQLLAAVDAYGVAARPVRCPLVERGCVRCVRGWIDVDDQLDPAPCPDCLPNLSAGNLPQGATA